MMLYASLLQMETVGEGIDVNISNPWHAGESLHKFWLSSGEVVNTSLHVDAEVLKLPLKRVVVSTNAHAKLLVELGIVETIAGVCDMEYISDSTIMKKYKEGDIIDCGNSMYPNVEKIMALNPDAVFLSPFEDAGYGQLESLNIPLVECADYMESSPLGRAEWIRFYGILFGVKERSDSLFHAIEQEYNTLKEKVLSSVEKRPTVMLDTKGGSAWYVAGGGSTIGRIIEDAGGDYIFSYLQKSGSVPLSFESVFEKAEHAQIWLLKNSMVRPLTYGLLSDDYKLYEEFEPFKNRNIWVCDVNMVPYFEETSLHPELVLREFCQIFHGDSVLSGGFRYYHRLDE